MLHARAGTASLLAVIYGVALTLVLGTSGPFHTPNWSLTARRRMQRLDHSMIYVLIAGSYAPFAFCLESAPRSMVLAISIGGGLMGWIKVHWWPHAPRLVTSFIYVLIGWCMAPFFPELYANIGPSLPPREIFEDRLADSADGIRKPCDVLAFIAWQPRGPL